MTFMMVVMMSVCFASCSKDDNDNDNDKEVTAAKLKGTWELCHVKGTSLDVNDKLITFDRDITSASEDLAWLENADFIDFVRYEFDLDYNFTSYVNYGSGFTNELHTTYTITGQTIIIDENDVDQQQFIVEKLTDTQLVIHSKETEEFDVHVTFKRIK